MIAAGDWAGFEHQAAWAREEGVPIRWLREILLQTYLFAGYPRAIQALRIVSRTATSADSRAFWREPPPAGAESLRRGEALCARIYGPRFAALVEAMDRTHPDLGRWMISEGYGRVLSRSFLTPRVRELALIPLLTAQESWPQLASHLDGARRVGARRREVAEAVEIGIHFSPRVDRLRARGEMRRFLDRSGA